MQVIVPPAPVLSAAASHGKTEVFLAGGITNCPEWQDELIAQLTAKIKDPSNTIVLYNPRRKDFDVKDPNASREQITWEFYALNQADIFTMWFAATEKSDQPICFYELGRHVTRLLAQQRSGDIIVGYDPLFRRKQDVDIQLELLSDKYNRTIKICKGFDEYVNSIVSRIS